MVETYNRWTCPNCGHFNRSALLDKQICVQCGWSEEEPEDDNWGYE